MIDSAALRRAEAVRHFNRFYTKHIGALHERLQKSVFSLTEVRVLHELARGRAQTAAVLTRNLGLDSGYLSRLLTSFERRKLITRRPSESDARQSLISLTDEGHAAYEPLDAVAIEEVMSVLDRLAGSSQEQLIGAMKLVERLLDDQPRRGIVTLRGPRGGEYGWLVHRQAVLFANEHGWDQSFEGLLARTVADFTLNRDPVRETLDRRTGPFDRRFGNGNGCVGDDCTHRTAIHRARHAPARHRHTTGQRMCALREARGLYQAHTFDRHNARRVAAALRARGFCLRELGTRAALRP